MHRILILADIRPMLSFHAVVVFALGKNLLFKSALGHCANVKTKWDIFSNFVSFSEYMNFTFLTLVSLISVDLE